MFSVEPGLPGRILWQETLRVLSPVLPQNPDGGSVADTATDSGNSPATESRRVRFCRRLERPAIARGSTGNAMPRTTDIATARSAPSAGSRDD